MLNISSEFENSILPGVIKTVIDSQSTQNLEVFFTGKYFDLNLSPTPWGIIAVLIPIVSSQETLGKTEENGKLYIIGTKYILQKT